jgi:hypothetical protein
MPCHVISPNAEDEVNLYWLADYFESVQLCKHFIEMWTLRIKFDTCKRYIQPALQLQLKPLIYILIHACSKSSLNFVDGGLEEFIQGVDAAFLMQLFQHRSTTKYTSGKTSEVAASFCDKHPVDADTFVSLTDAKLLPHISPKAAWTLLDKASELSLESTVFASLEDRCITALAEDFVELDTAEKSPLRRQSAAFLMKLMEKAQKNVTRK